MEKTLGKYIYCVMRKPKSFGFDLRGVGGGDVHLITSEKLAIAVSDAPILEDYPITRENTVTHQRVIEEIMRLHSPVLPVSFGTMAENKTVVEKKLLDLKQSELLDELQSVDGKVELNLKAIWLDMPSTFQKVVAENPDLALLKKELGGSRIGLDSTIKIGKLVEEGLQARRNKIREDILSLFKDIVIDHKDTPRLGEQMIFNIAVLIPEKEQKTFDKIVRNLDAQYADENAYFKYIGPIPPFNFVRMSITLI